MTKKEIKNSALKFFQGNPTSEEVKHLHPGYKTKGGSSEAFIVDIEESNPGIKERRVPVMI